MIPEGEVPYTWSACCDLPERKVVDLVPYGFESVPVMGWHAAKTIADGSVMHRHRAYEITVCERGSVKFDFGGTVYSLLPGRVLVTPPGEVHAIRNYTRGSVLRWIFFVPPKKGESALGLVKAESDVLVKRLQECRDHLYRIPFLAQAILPRMMEALSFPHAAERSLCLRSGLLQFLLLIVASTPVAKADMNDRKLQSVIATMRRNPEKGYPIKDLILMTGLGESSVSTAFKRATGHTPHDFLVTCRIHKAMDLIAANPNLSVTKLALDLGFSTPQHFAARFKRETGKTPSEWQKTVK